MKKSIRLKFTAIFAVVIALILFMTWALNTFGLISYYTSERSGSMGMMFSELDNALTAGEDPSELVTQFSDKYNMSIMLYDSYKNKIIASSQRDGEYLFKRLWDRLFSDEEEKQELTVI